MTGSEFPDSVFTFNLLESTTWYNKNNKQSEPFNWGKDEGCSIAKGKFVQGLREFCTTGNEGCSSDFTGISICSSEDVLTDGCGYWRAYVEYGGYHGNYDKCFYTTLSTKIGFQGLISDCFQAICQNNIVTFSISNKSYQCVTQGQVINVRYSNYNAKVTCPDIKYFCNIQRVCSNSCSGVGEEPHAIVGLDIVGQIVRYKNDYHQIKQLKQHYPLKAAYLIFLSLALLIFQIFS